MIEAARSDSKLDGVLARDDLFWLETAELEDLRFALLLDAFARVVARHATYARYCEREGFDAERLAAERTLTDIPLLPSRIFKHGVGEPAEGEDVLLTTSSGTMGGVSVVPRDDATLTRFYAGLAAVVRELLRGENANALILNLGPSAREARALWISYVMAGAAVLHPSRSYVRDGVLDIERACADLLATSDRAVVVGPPQLLLEFARAASCAMAGDHRRRDVMVVSIGGWKVRGGETIARAAFQAEIASSLRISEGDIRDAFSMVELNSVVLECESHRKHLPPWLHARARDPRTLAVLPTGEEGILAYLDATAASYPGFVLSDDLGSVEHAVRCSCGRTGDLLTVTRRVKRVEARGCALRM